MSKFLKFYLNHMKKILFIIAHNDFQPIEYNVPKQILAQAGIEVVTVSDKSGVATAAQTGEKVLVDKTLEEIKDADYDGVFFIGGPGALEHLDDEKSYRLVREISQSGKLWGAICISPRILAKAGVLQGKEVTGWDGDGELAGILSSAGAKYIHQSVVVDGKLITAAGPRSAEEFGRKIAALV